MERALDVPTWAIKNVYIGMQCQHNCMGHGACMYGVLCQCDENYSGDFCQIAQHNPTFIKEDFNGRLRKRLNHISCHSIPSLTEHACMIALAIGPVTLHRSQFVCSEKFYVNHVFILEIQHAENQLRTLAIHVSA